MGQVVFRRSVLDQAGIWDERLMANDFDFVLRAAAVGFDFEYVPGVVLNFRRYTGWMSKSSNWAKRVTALRPRAGCCRCVPRGSLNGSSLRHLTVQFVERYVVISSLRSGMTHARPMESGA
jgi:hypothetical protein